ncbi:MAG TPA: hypothetical protein VGR78_13950 [Verrucomicrobiae bacterium]|nr:hypothetical protein [Verrucomicrobiae bacterium]
MKSLLAVAFSTLFFWPHFVTAADPGSSPRANTFEAPSVDDILAKVTQHGNDPVSDDARVAFAYDRTSRVDYLDERGGLKNQVVRLYHVEPLNGKSVTKLLSVNGRAPTEKEEHSRSAARETGDKTRSLELSEDVLSRFDFVLKGSDSFMNRPVWVLGFSPKADAPINGFTDRLINAMSGTIWIDQTDFQMAKADIHLSHRVSFFGGLAGAIDHLDLHLVQKRLAPDIWLAEALTLDFTGRKLFSPMRFRCFENCSGFREGTKAQASSAR